MAGTMRNENLPLGNLLILELNLYCSAFQHAIWLSLQEPNGKLFIVVVPNLILQDHLFFLHFIFKLSFWRMWSMGTASFNFSQVHQFRQHIDYTHYTFWLPVLWSLHLFQGPQNPPTNDSVIIGLKTM